MYLPTSEACDVPSGTDVPTAVLARSAAALVADDTSINNAQAAFASLLTRSPADYWALGPGVAVDVAAVNAQTVAAAGAVQQGSAPGGAGNANARNPNWAPYRRGRGVYGSGGGNTNAAPSIAPSCDVSSSGGCNVIPLNGPGSSGSPRASAQVPPQRTSQGVQLPGLGRYRGGPRSRVRAVRARGMGQCCNDNVSWGDAFPAGGPVASPGQQVLNWLQQNPLIALAGAALGIWIVSESQKGKRG